VSARIKTPFCKRTCLLAREQEDTRFVAIRRKFEEETVFPMFKDDEAKIASFHAAMGEIANLNKTIQEAKLLTWVREWFATIG
jgi:hypothetical protein